MPDRNTRPPNHDDIFKRIGEMDAAQRADLAEIKGEIRGRFDGVDREVGGIRDDLSDLNARLAVVESDEQRRRARLQARIAGLGPERRGLKWWLGCIAAGVAVLGGLATAWKTLTFLFVAIVHALNTLPPGK